MIVLKLGGTSVGDAESMLRAAAIVRSRASRQPLVVVSALARVTDLLTEAVAAAARGDHDAQEPPVAEVQRRHRWVLGGCLEEAERRHDLSLEIDARFDDLRQLLRSVRVLGEVTPRASDTLLAFGEMLSSRLFVAVLRSRGVPAEWVDPRDVVVTDGSFGAARPLEDRIAEACERKLLPLFAAGRVPVVGGFVGATVEGVTTTLGRGGSDTSAAVLGAALGVEEIEIWSDVHGVMTADPRRVPAARPLPSLSFAEVAELSRFGAKVLHPAAVAPAVRRGIPVRVLNSREPSAPGTVLLDEPEPNASPLASVASRAGLAVVRARTGGRMPAADLLERMLRSLSARGVRAELVLSAEAAVAVVAPDGAALRGLEVEAGSEVGLEVAAGRSVVCVVGFGLERDDRLRGEVAESIAKLRPEMVVLGASPLAVAAVLPEDRLTEAVRSLHSEFFETTGERS